MQSVALQRTVSSDAWHLLWCSKRCFKQDQSQRMANLQIMVADAGGKLVCKRKAQQLTQRRPSFRWRSSSSPLVLVTDWREAKPCLQSLMVEANANKWPSLMIVACDDQVLNRRASLWQQTLGDIGIEVVVCLFDELEEMLAPGGLISERVLDELEERGLEDCRSCFSIDQKMLDCADAETSLGTTRSGESSPRSIEDHETIKHETVFADNFNFGALSATAKACVSAPPGRFITDAASNENSIYKAKSVSPPPGRFITDVASNDNFSYTALPVQSFLNVALGPLNALGQVHTQGNEALARSWAERMERLLKEHEPDHYED